MATPTLEQLNDPAFVEMLRSDPAAFFECYFPTKLVDIVNRAAEQTLANALGMRVKIDPTLPPDVIQLRR